MMTTRFVKPKIDKYIQLYSKNANVPEGDFSGKIKNIVVNDGGFEYNSVPEVTISAPNLTGGTQATATAVITDKQVSSITINEEGTGYTTSAQVYISGQSDNSVKFTKIENGGTYHNVPLLTISEPDTSGGTQATATCTITNNAIEAVVITNNGTGYTNDPIVTISGGVSSIQVTNKGQWYGEFEGLGTDPTITISAPDITGGTQATATATWGANGGINDITLTEKGSGYSNPPSVAVVAPFFKPQEGNYHYSVRFINVTNGGSGYTTPPSVVISEPLDVNGNPLNSYPYSRATAHAVLNEAGSVTYIILDNYGVGYTSNPTVTITTVSGSSGGGATADAYITVGFGAEATSIVESGGEISAYIRDGMGATAFAELEVYPTTATKYAWNLQNPIEINENALIQVVDRQFTGIESADIDTPIVIRMFEVSSKSTVNTLNSSRNNASFYTGTIIDMGKPDKKFPSDIKLEIAPQNIQRIILSLNQGISSESGIDYGTEFIIILKVTEKEPTMIEYGSLNNMNINQI